MLASLSAVWRRLLVIETEQRQQTRLLQAVFAAVQAGGADGTYDLPNGVTLPARSLQELLDIEKLLENGDNVHKMVCIRHDMIIH